MMEDKKCKWDCGVGECGLLKAKLCEESNYSSCKFYKTQAQYTEAADRSIDLCRIKGLCSDCKYSKNICRKSNEGR